MLYGKYTFTCRFETDAALPPYKGSTFRGAFGTALKRVVCVLKRQECPDCMLKERCLYTCLFETRLVSGNVVSRNSTHPHPFVLEPPPTDQTDWRAGDHLDCSLVLFGEINKSLPYLVYAFEQMGKFGLGKRIDGRRGRFAVESVSTGKGEIYHAENGKLRAAGTWDELAPPAATEGSDESLRLQVDLQTPLRLKFENRLQAELPFHLLVRAALRRVSSLFAAYGGGEPGLDYKGLVQLAETVRIVQNGLRWIDWRRYSNRQEREMLMGGMIGMITYEGRLAEFLPLLETCSQLHIGKQTSFGLGKIGLREEGIERD
jgi:hypothetical protein